MAPLPASQLQTINDKLAIYVQRWQKYPTIHKMGMAPIGDGSVQDLYALDYLLYEQCEPLVIESPQDFIELASHLLGNCLVKLLKFEWCELSFLSRSTLGVRDLNGELLIPLDAAVTMRNLHANNYNPNEGEFGNLFLNIYLSKRNWRLDYHGHFLVASLLDFESEKQSYEQYWGFEVPEEIIQRYSRLAMIDEAQTVRFFGLTAYEWKKIPNWLKVQNSLTYVEKFFDSLFTYSWRERAQTKLDQLNTIPSDLITLPLKRI